MQKLTDSHTFLTHLRKIAQPVSNGSNYAKVVNEKLLLLDYGNLSGFIL